MPNQAQRGQITVVTKGGNTPQTGHQPTALSPRANLEPPSNLVKDLSWNLTLNCQPLKTLTANKHRRGLTITFGY